MLKRHSELSSGGLAFSIHRLDPATRAAGPGLRAVVWVQGCPLRCPGCSNVEALPFEGGVPVATDALAALLLRLPGIEGVTFSGGEPFAHAAALTDLADRVRAGGLSVVCYTGYTIKDLWARGDSAELGLLGLVDLLIDGPFLLARREVLPWRGSSNQRLLFLTDRYGPADVPAQGSPPRVDVTVSSGSLALTGHLSSGEGRKLNAALARHGIHVCKSL